MQTDNAGQLQTLPEVDALHEVDALNALAQENSHQKPAEALRYAQAACCLAAEIGYLPGLALGLKTQGDCFHTLNNYDQAKSLLQQGLEISRALNNRVLEAECLKELAAVGKSLADFPAVLNDALQELTIRQELEDRSGEALANNSIGSAYRNLGNLDKALFYYREALRLREALDNKRDVAASLNNIGNVYGELGDDAAAQHCHLQCVDMSRQLGNVHGEIYFLSNLAGDYSRLGCHQDAIATGRIAVALARSHELQFHECLALESLAGACCRGEQLEEALTLYQEAEVLAHILSDRRLECQISVALGDIFVKQGDRSRARSAFCRALEIAEAGGIKQVLIPACAGLSELCEVEGELAQALTYYKKYRTLEKEVFNEAADKRSKALMAQMQVEKARQEAELHRIKNVELAEANRQLQEQAELLQMQAEELRAQADELARQAMEDGLTGLANRRALEGFLAQQFADAVRHQRPLTVVLADIDHFKQVNDRFGHQIGDEVLMTVALLFRQTCRASDLAARYGGEEFALVLPETPGSAGMAFCERLRVTVAEHPWGEIQTGLAVTLSLGVSDDLTLPNYERLLGLADAQLYRAKENGRNRVCFAEKTSDQ